jgi:hypothetical protein
MAPPSPFRHLRSHVFCWGFWIVGFLCSLDYYIVLVTVSWIGDFYFYAEDYCDGVVILVCVFLCCDMPPPLLRIICCLLSSIHLVLLGAYVPSGLLDLVVLYAGMLELPPMLLPEFLG